jgi:hypothetical protein
MDAQFEQLQNLILSVIDRYSEESLLRSGAPGKWSAAEVVEHLSLTYTLTTKAFRRCLEAGQPLAGSPTFRQRMVIIAVLGLGYFPRGREAPAAVHPKGLGRKSLSQLKASIRDMDEIIALCEVRYGKASRIVDHPVLGPLTARQWRKFHWVHTRHHAKLMLEEQSSAGCDCSARQS